MTRKWKTSRKRRGKKLHMNGGVSTGTESKGKVKGNYFLGEKKEK